MKRKFANFPGKQIYISIYTFLFLPLRDRMEQNIMCTSRIWIIQIKVAEDLFGLNPHLAFW